MKKDKFLIKKNKLENKNTLPQDFIDKQGKKYFFNWIKNCNIHEIIHIRNRNDVVNTSKTKKKINLEEHTFFLQNYTNIPRIDFVFEDSDSAILVGGVSINLTDTGLEVGKYIGREEYLGRGIAKAATISFLEFFDEEFSGTELFSITRENNTINISINKKLGFVFDKELKNGFILMKRV